MKIEEVLQIKEQMMGDYSVQAVSARSLHEALESARDYGTWVKAKIKSLKMVLGKDYVDAIATIHREGEDGSKAPLRVIDHIIPIDTAKTIAMMTATPAGDAVRAYFLACEKKVQQTTQIALASNDSIIQQLESRVSNNMRILNMAFANVHDGIRVANILEVKTKLEQETGTTIELPAQIQQFIVESKNVEFDPTTDTAFASKVAIGRNYITVSQIAKDFHPLTSTDINGMLVNMGYLKRTGLSTYSVTNAGREFASTRTLQSGPNKGVENVTGWNLDDIRFWEPFNEMLIAQRDLKKKQLANKRR